MGALMKLIRGCCKPKSTEKTELVMDKDQLENELSEYEEQGLNIKNDLDVAPLDYFMKRGAYCVYWNGVLVKAPTLENLREKIVNKKQGG